MHVSPAVRALLEARFARRTPGTPEGLRAVLEEKGYTFRPNVAAFDAVYGGFTFPQTERGPDWSVTEDRGWMVGAELCLREGGHGAPRGGDEEAEHELVPVAYSPNDCIYYLDREGRGWFEDTIEGPPFLCTEDGDRLFAQIVLELIFVGPERAVTHEGFVGAELAHTYGLSPVPEASDVYTRWWSGERGFVAEFAPRDADDDDDADDDAHRARTCALVR